MATDARSGPSHGVSVRLDVGVEVRDGTRLSTDLYRPTDPGTGDPVAEPKPALLVRTPYDKRDRDRIEHQGRWYARRGYVVAIQDVRGRYESDGSFYLLKNEAEDGADAVEWLADLPCCDGQVGTMGTSYMAWTQSALATQDPEGLAAMFVNQGAADAWDATLRHGGAFELRWLCWAFTLGAPFAPRTDERPALAELLARTDTRDLLADGPIREGASPLREFPEHEEYLFDYATTPGDDAFWDDPSIGFARHYDAMADVPTVYAGSWYDSYAKATCENFAALSERKAADQFLLMGAWTHGGHSTWTRTFAGEVDYGEAATRDYRATKLAFFDHYLKGRETWDAAPVEYVRMGTGSGGRTDGGRLDYGGEWAADDEWPLPGTAFTRYYARPDGSLATEPPEVESAATTYRYDPADPVPTLGGNCSSYYRFEDREESLAELPVADRHTESITGRGGYDQRTRPDTFGATPPYGPLAERDDVLAFRTPPLSDPVEIAGPITVRAYAETDAPDTDFTAKLVDEFPPSDAHPEGFALNLADSIRRARYREGREPSPVDPGTVYEFEIEPYPTATTFAAGHRIRLDVSSSNYPRYDANPNTAGPPYGDRDRRVAHNTVHHSAAYPTHVELPVRPREG